MVETLAENSDIEAVGERHLIGQSDEDLPEQSGGFLYVGVFAQFAAFDPPRMMSFQSSSSFSIHSWSLCLPSG